METTRSKQVAAAVAAVLQYAAEVEAVASTSPASPPPAPPRPGPTLWGSAGRQDAMMLRSLWQRRIARSW